MASILTQVGEFSEQNIAGIGPDSYRAKRGFGAAQRFSAAITSLFSAAAFSRWGTSCGRRRKIPQRLKPLCFLAFPQVWRPAPPG